MIVLLDYKQTLKICALAYIRWYFENNNLLLVEHKACTGEYSTAASVQKWQGANIPQTSAAQAIRTILEMVSMTNSCPRKDQSEWLERITNVPIIKRKD